MPLPDAIRRIAECAPGKRLTIVVDGKPSELPLKAEAVPVDPPDPIETLSSELLDRDARMRATFEESCERSDAALNSIKNVAASLADGQERIARNIGELADAAEKWPAVLAKTPAVPSAFQIDLAARIAVDKRLAETKAPAPITYDFEVVRGPDGLITHIIMRPVG